MQNNQSENEVVMKIHENFIYLCYLDMRIANENFTMSFKYMLS